jgi:hypothetical protein
MKNKELAMQTDRQAQRSNQIRALARPRPDTFAAVIAALVIVALFTPAAHAQGAPAASPAQSAAAPVSAPTSANGAAGYFTGTVLRSAHYRRA